MKRIGEESLTISVFGLVRGQAVGRGAICSLVAIVVFAVVFLGSL